MKTKKLLTTLLAVGATTLTLSTPADAWAAGTQLMATVPAAAIIGKDRKTVPSKLNDATIFFHGAELSHTASAHLNKGENEIYVEGLSHRIDINTVKIKTSGRAVVASYEFSVDFLHDPADIDPRLKPLEKEIDQKKGELRQVEIDIKIQEEIRQFLKEGTTKNVSGSEQGMGIDDLKKAMDYYKVKSGEIETALVNLNVHKTKISEELTRLSNQLNQEKLEGNRTSGVLKLYVSSPAEGNVNFEISYLTPSANWSPVYDINIESTDRPFILTAKAKVSQITGLDWDNVRLTLSTATPGNGKVAPLFSAWFLYPYIEKAPRSKGDGGEMLMSKQNSTSYSALSFDFADFEEMDEGADVSGMSDYVNSSDNALNMVYNIDIPYSIPGNGKIQNIDLLTKQVNAEYKYYSAPKLDFETYVIAEVPDWQKLDLLSAPANVTYDGTNIGETYIDASGTNEKMSFTLGTDRRITVKREKMTDYSSKSTFGGTTEQVLTYRITVKNNLKTAIKMVTKEQFPISTQKDIVVTLREKQTTRWSAKVDEVGVVTWEEELQAGETKVYELSYSVKYPKDMTLKL